ncbi:MAG: hypothetical protein WCL00_09055 [Bacteroidota bacterium]
MQRNHNLRNRMRESRSSGSVGERGGNDPLYPEIRNLAKNKTFRLLEYNYQISFKY